MTRAARSARRIGFATWSNRSSTPIRWDSTSFGIGEHHRKDYLDSAPPVILAAAAARTSRIRLTSAVTVLSSADPVRVFQQFATLDLMSQGRAEMVVGRGSFIDSFPLFGLRPRGLRLAVRRKARSAPRDPRQRARPLVRQAPRAVDGAGRLPETAPESVADLARRRRDAAIVRARRNARPSADGRHHRRRDAALSAARRSLPRSGRARRALGRSTQGRRALARLRRRHDASRRPTTSFPATPARSPTSRRNADGGPSPERTSTRSAARTARC